MSGDFPEHDRLRGVASAVGHDGRYPLGTLGYAEVTSNGSAFTTIVDHSGLSVTVTVGSSRRVRITAKVDYASTVGADIVELYIRESSTQLQRCVITCPAGASAQTATAIWVGTPSAGSHTYKLSAARTVGTGNANLLAASTHPASVLVEDIGAA